jgi:hypothetical protein
MLGLAAAWIWSEHRLRRMVEGAAIAVFCLVANLPWLLALRHQTALRGSFEYDIFLAGAPQVAYDFLLGALHLARRPSHEVGVMGPLVALALIAVPRVERRAACTLGAFAVSLGALAYFGTRLGLMGAQPYRFAIPATAVLSIFASPVVHATLAGRVSLRRAATVALLLLVFADQARVRSGLRSYLGAGLGETDRWALDALRQHAPGAGWQHAGRVLGECEHIRDPVAGRSRSHRMAYSFAALERYLPAEFIGSPLLPTLTLQEPASFWRGRLFRRPLESYDAAGLAAALDLYDVGFVLTARSATRERLVALEPRLRLLAETDTRALFSVERTPSRVLDGAGAAWSDGETIFFETDRAESAVLSYHWFPGLAADPPAPLAPSVDRNGAVTPFVEIHAPRSGRYRIALATP